MSSEEDISRSSYEELRETMENQQKAYIRINQLAVDLAKIDLLTVSAVLAGVSLSGLSPSLLLLAGLLTFVYALWCCTRVYEPRSFTHGIGSSAVEDIDESVLEGKEVEEHYRQLRFSYRNAIRQLAVAYSSVRAMFRRALWASLTAIIFFSLVVTRRLLPPYPAKFDVAVVAVVVVVVLWGKDKYEKE